MLDLVVRALEMPLRSAQGSTLVETRDAIVVLGAPLHPSGALTQILDERVVAAAGLYHAGGAARVIASGGITHGAPRAESDAIAEGLASAGVPAAAIVIERRSRTTVENARFTAELLPPTARVWIVTQPFHERRAVRLFASAGLDARAWHIADSLQYRDRRRALRWIAREYAAWAKLYATR